MPLAALQKIVTVFAKKLGGRFGRVLRVGGKRASVNSQGSFFSGLDRYSLQPVLVWKNIPHKLRPTGAPSLSLSGGSQTIISERFSLSLAGRSATTRQGMALPRGADPSQT